MPTAFDAMNYLWQSSIELGEKRRIENHDDTKPRKFWASKVGGCLRASLYCQAKVTPSNPPKQGVQERMNIGTYVENQVLAMLEQQVIALGAGTMERQVRVENADHMAKTDAVLNLSAPLTIDGATFGPCLPIAIEIKSLHPQALDRRTKEMDGQWMPYEHHILQTLQWVEIAGETRQVEQFAVLLYVSLDGRRRIDIIQLRDYREELLHRWYLLETYRVDGTLPERLNAKRYPCTYCDYFDHCWEE